MKLPDTAIAIAMSKALRVGGENPKKGFQGMKNSMQDTGKFKHAEPDADERGGKSDGDIDDMKRGMR